MVNFFIGKFFGNMIEQIISSWTEDDGKRAKGQAGFKSRHSTIDHSFTFRDLTEKIWDKQGETSYCCFVDYKKVFDSV